MSRPNVYADRKTFAIRIAPEIRQRLEDESLARDLSVNWLVNRAIVDFLDRLIPVDELRLTRDQ